MASDNNKKHDGPSAEDKALDLIANLLIEKMEGIQADWKKPWIAPNAAQWPKNLNSRDYAGSNALILSLQAEKNNYPLNIWCTHDRLFSLNFEKDKDGKAKWATNDKGENLPAVKVNKGEKSTPVFITTFTCVKNEESKDGKPKEKIKYDDYRQLSEEERAKYKVYPKLQVYSVFNLSQTNLKEVRPEYYQKIADKFQQNMPEHKGEQFTFPAMDKMIKDDLWYCPIHEKEGDEAYYSISRDEIVVPKREQFIDNESFYSNLFHEMNHSTHAESRLGLIKKSAWAGKDYSVEEMRSELGAAVVASKYGIVKHIKSDSLPYLKSWLDNIHENPGFLKSILMDVKHSASMINQRIDRIQLAIDEGEEITKADFPEETKTKSSDKEQKVEETENLAAKGVKNALQTGKTLEFNPKKEEQEEQRPHFGRGR